MKNNLKSKLITARKDKGWTQTQLAKKLGLNVKNVQRWELGSSKPSFEMAAMLAKALNVSLDYLAGLDVTSSGNKLHSQAMGLVAELPEKKLKALIELMG